MPDDPKGAAVQDKPPVADNPTPSPGVTPIQFNLSEALKRASAEKLRTEQNRSPKKPEEKKPEATKEDPKKQEEPKKDDQAPKSADKPPAESAPKEQRPPEAEQRITEPKNNAERFRMLEQERDEVRQAREQLAAELEELRQKATGSESLSQRLAEYEKTSEELKKERDSYRERVRAFDVTADPEFKKRYDEPIMELQKDLFKMLVGTGASQEDVLAAFNSWTGDNDEVFEPFLEDLSRLRVDSIAGSINKIKDLNNARKKEMADAKSLVEKFDKEKQEKARASIIERETESARMVDDFFRSQPNLKDNADLRNLISQDALKAARGEMSHAEISQRLIELHTLGHIAQDQHNFISTLQTQLEEKDKKIAELEKFAKDQSAGIEGESSVAQPGSAYVPLSKRIKVQ